MNIKVSFLSLFFFIFFFALFFPKIAFADTITLSGSVKDSSGNAIVGATVSVNTPSSDNTNTDSSGNYNLSIPGGTYNVQVAPPSGSNFSSVLAVNRNISANTVLNFVLVPTGTVTLSGKVLDRSNQPLVNQTVSIAPSGTSNFTNSVSDTNGNYSFSVTPGNYRINISGSNPLTVSAPPSYSIQSSGTLALTQSIIMDIPVPVKQVVLHVQDVNGVTQPNIGISTIGPSLPNIPIGTVTNATGTLSYSSSLGLQTDSSGNVTLWLFQTPPSGNRYTITATPPSGSPFVTTNLSSVAITGDTNVTLTIAAPVTLSGKVLDGTGQPLANQTVGIAPSGTSNFISSTSDSGGNYSFSVAPGDYKIRISGINPLTINAPPNYSSLSSGTLSLTHNTTMDIPLPIKEVTLHVQDANGVSQANIAITTNAPSLPAPIGTVTNASGTNGYSSSVGLQTNSSGNATLWLYQTPVSGNRYTITATPPSGSNLVTTNLSGIAINGPTQLTLTMTTPVTLSGRVLDRDNHPLVNQTVAIAPSGTGNYISSITDTNGNYSFTVTNGNYLIKVFGNNPLDASAPPSYSIQSSGTLSLTQNTTMDIPIPAKQVAIHVQDVNGSPRSNIAIETNAPSLPNIPIGTVTNATGISNYSSSLGVTTDANGNATLWLFQTPLSGNRYTITARPPTESIFNTFSLTNVEVTADQTEVISLEYNHVAPVTTISLSPEPNGEEEYSDPTTVMLAASATSGYSVANTYYKVDSGLQQAYSDPFAVTGAGNHTITYWSIDNSGVEETHKTKTFTIPEQQTLVTAINAGGESVGDFVADAGYTGGSQYTTSDTVDTSEVENPAPQEVYKSVRYGNFSYTISNLTPNASYGVRMHFNELYWDHAGARVFDVKYNGQTVLNNYDIYERAGGKNKAIVQEVNGTADNDGKITLQFITKLDNAMVNGIEIYSGALDIPTPTPTPPLTPPYAINTGGSAVSSFLADRNFNGGSLYTTTNSVDRSGVTSPAPEAVYQTVRYGNFTYTLPNLTPDGNYILRLHFNELYWSEAGKRVFDVFVNGAQVLQNFDIYDAAGGANKAIVEEIPVTANEEGNLIVQFSTLVDNAMINAIEVTPAN